MDIEPKNIPSVIKGEKETARIEAFSDAVFAIAITLLVLDIIEARHTSNGKSLLDSLINQWEIFVAFLTGFFTILVCWINHHYMFTFIVRFDNKMIWLNGFLLLVVTFVPFPTAILAEHIHDESQTAITIYGFTLS